LKFSNASWFLEFARMRIEVVDEGAPTRLSNLVVESKLLTWIKATQLENLE
jgi:hypothetical protein